MIKGSLAVRVGLLLLLIATPAISDEYRIAVRANKGRTEALQRWQATADYLNQAIPQHHFTIIPFENNSGLNEAISNHVALFCITNPAASVELKIRYGLQPIATLLNKRQGKGYSQFGSVIFTRADRQDINALIDLKGKTFLGADELGFGGWRVAWKELLNNGVAPYHDFKELRFAGGNQNTVVHSVLHGKVDAGAVRTDMLEGMAAAGEIKLSDFKVLGAKQVAGFPFLLSTELYPEWLFSASKTISNELRIIVTQALLSIKQDDSAAVAGRYVGWISPIDYAPVERLLQDLKLGPFRMTTTDLLREFIKTYAYALLATLLLTIGLLFAFLYVARLNHRINRTQTRLMAEISNRERADQALTSLAQQSLEFSKEEQFFNLCLSELSQLFATKYSFIGLFADTEKTRIKTYAVLADNHLADNFEYSLVGTPCQDVLNLEVELITHDAAKRYPNDILLKQMAVDSYYGAPLISPSGEMMGLVSVMDTRPLHPEKMSRAVLKIFANRIALEIQRKREAEALQGMADQLSYQASHDVLTNLVNRREFEVRLKSAWGSAKNQQQQHALCYLDLDQFKVINDTHGHQAGDELLKQISAMLSNIVRGSDTLARLGGDEFGVLLLDCPLDRAREIAEKLLVAVRDFQFHYHGEIFQIGVSIGIARIDSDSEDVYALFQAADSACYHAKNQGRNRIHIHGASDNDVLPPS